MKELKLLTIAIPELKSLASSFEENNKRPVVSE